MKTQTFLIFALVALVSALCVLAAPIGDAATPLRISEVHDLIESEMKEMFGVDSPPDGIIETYMVEMRDGIRLETRVFIPRSSQGKRVPAVMDRTPYGPAYTAMSLLWAIDGYVIVMQDQRGTYGSEGNFEIWRNDYHDAYDTCAWIAEQPWSDGKVMTFGVSADGVSVYAQAGDEGNPWIAAQFPVFGVSNGHKLAYPQGMYRKQLIEKWLKSVCVECIDDVKANEVYSDWWYYLNMTDHYHQVKWPSVHWGGWYDIFLDGQVEAWNGYRYEADPAHREGSYLFLDPHGHCYDHVWVSGISALPLRMGREMFMTAWTGEKPKDSLFDKLGHVTFYVMGPQGELAPTGNYYTSLDHFPTAEPTEYFLRSDNSLSLDRAEFFEQSLSYTYDPLHPVPTVGGTNLFGTCGPYDQAELEARDDVLVFTTSPLRSDVAIVGPVTVKLFVSSTAVDTDFTVKLTDVYPDGESHLITEGAQRMRWREDIEEPKMMEKGIVYEIEVELWPTAMVFNRRHSIRVTVSSSNADRWNAHTNSGELVEFETMDDAITTTNTVFLGKDRPSKVTLPVVSLDQLPPVNIRAWDGRGDDGEANIAA